MKVGTREMMKKMARVIFLRRKFRLIVTIFLQNLELISGWETNWQLLNKQQKMLTPKIKTKKLELSNSKIGQPTFQTVNELKGLLTQTSKRQTVYKKVYNIPRKTNKILRNSFDLLINLSSPLMVPCHLLWINPMTAGILC